jgi:SAM-dependent methyltransferase
MHHVVLHRLTGNDPLGALIAKAADKFQWLPRTKAGMNARFLDVGCGSGKLLLLLQGLGMRHLAGADPFIDTDIHYPGGLTIHKRDVFAMEGSFDLIHLGHAFEHMAEPLEVLKRLRELLAPGGTAIIRIPVADSYAWRHYGVEWVQLDAPRHLYLHTSASMHRLAEQAGLEFAAEQRDSSVFQFVGSEKYRLGLLLDAPDPFTRVQRKAWARHARALNAEGTGDTATFHLRRP